MFSIIISEKGGAERKEPFEKTEVTVGRVQGNDLMLPKGNVSKHHAKLLFRDGRFIVTDLKSTNGTYVNGRKIAQATIVREGDKIYIGDFVLRLDGGANLAAEGSPPLGDPAFDRGDAADGSDDPLRTGPPGILGHRVRPPDSPVQRDSEGGLTDDVDPPRAAAPAAPSPQIAPQMTMPARVFTKGPVVPPRISPVTAPPHLGALSGLAVGQPLAPSPIATGAEGMPLGATSQSPVRASVVVPAPVRNPVLRVTPEQAGRRLALMTLADRVADAIDLTPLRTSPNVPSELAATLDSLVRKEAAEMLDEGEIPEGTDVQVLVREGLRELLGTGPFGALLEDDDVSEIHCARHDQVIAVRNGVMAFADTSFTSEEALRRAIARLAEQSGAPWKPGETVIERRMSRGAYLFAITPPASSAHIVTIRKRKRIETSLEDLVKGGALSRAMATFIEHCVQARANVIVYGSAGAGVASFIAAMLSAGPQGDRITIIQDIDDVTFSTQGHVVSLTLQDGQGGGESIVRAASRMRPDRLIVVQLTSRTAAATLDAIAEGADGVVAGMAAPSLRQATSRLVAQLGGARAGLTVEFARENVAEFFDVAIELGRVADGRTRVVRMSEFSGSDSKGIASRELFTATGDANSDGAFVATGVVPRAFSEFAARGIKVDPGLFKRGPSRG